MGLGQIMKENPLSGHFPCACMCKQVGREVTGWGEERDNASVASWRTEEREIRLTHPHWQFYFIPRSCNLSSLEIDLAYRCVLFGQHDVLKNFELVANF